MFRSKEAMMIAALSFGQFMDTISDLIFLQKYRRYGDHEGFWPCDSANEVGSFSEQNSNIAGPGDHALMKAAQFFCFVLFIVIILKETVKAACTASLFNHPYFHSPDNFQNLHTSPFLWLLMLSSSRVQNLAVRSADEATEKPALLHLAVDLVSEDIPQLVVTAMFFAATSDVPCELLYSNTWSGRDTACSWKITPNCQTPVCSSSDRPGSCNSDNMNAVDGVMIFSLLMTFVSVACKIYKAARVITLQRTQLLSGASVTYAQPPQLPNEMELAPARADGGAERIGAVEEILGSVRGAVVANRKRIYDLELAARAAAGDRGRVEALEQQVEQMAVALASLQSVEATRAEESVKLLGA
jgi:hypothetical protein